MAAVAATPLVAVGFSSSPAGAAEIQVTNSNDSGPNSLRAALAQAASQAGPDDVVVQAGLGPITLTTGEITWVGADPVTIIGNGVSINANGAIAALVDAGGSGLTVNGVSISGVGGSTSDNSAPIVSDGGALVVTNCTLTGNHATSTGEEAAGGVLSLGGPVTVSDCTITGNTAVNDDDDASGGIQSQGGTMIVTTSTISGNTANAVDDAGGGILSDANLITIRDSTINCNTATADEEAGGGIMNEGDDVTINGSSVVGNVANGVETSENQINTAGGVISGSGNTISDDTSICAVPPPPPEPQPEPSPVVELQPTFTG